MCTFKQSTLGRKNFTKIKFPIARLPRQQIRNALHLVAANLIMIDIIVVAVTKGPEVVCLMFPLDLTKGVCRRRGGSIENGIVEMFGFDLDVKNISDKRHSVKVPLGTPGMNTRRNRRSMANPVGNVGRRGEGLKNRRTEFGTLTSQSSMSSLSFTESQSNSPVSITPVSSPGPPMRTAP